MIIQNSMKIHHGGDAYSYHICASVRNHKEINLKTVIPTFYSTQNAVDKGWKCTDSIQFCSPTMPYVWICPECASKYKWSK